MGEEQKPEAPDQKPDEKQTEYTPVEQEAMEMGWVPKDQWKGAEEDWTPAKAYIKYGKLEAEHKATKATASQKEKVINAMKDHYTRVKDDAKKEVEATLKKQKRDAIKEENYARAAEIDLQLDELTENLDRKTRVHDEEVKRIDNTAIDAVPPEFYEWNKRNSWYSMNGGDPLSQEADTLAIAYRGRFPKSTYPEVLEYVTTTIKKLYPERFPNPARNTPAAVNEPSATPSGEAKKKGPKLTDAERQAADAFGISYEDYAKSLKEWDTKKGVTA